MVKKNGSNLSTIILAAGIGRKMKPIIAKSLCSLDATTTLLDKQIETVRRVYPKSEIILVTGFNSDKVISRAPKDVKIVENETYLDNCTSRSLELALRVSSYSNLLLVHGDIAFNENAIRSVVQKGSTILIESAGQISNDKIGVHLKESGLVDNFSYGQIKKWGQLAYVSNGETRLLKKFCNDRRSYLFEVLNKVINAGGHIAATEGVDVQLAEIDINQDVEKARKIYDKTKTAS